MPATDLWVPYGAIGLLLGLIGWIARTVISREIARADVAEQREREMRDRIDERIVPLMADVAKELARFTETQR